MTTYNLYYDRVIKEKGEPDFKKSQKKEGLSFTALMQEVDRLTASKPDNWIRRMDPSEDLVNDCCDVFIRYEPKDGYTNWTE